MHDAQDVLYRRELIYPGQTGGLVIFEDRPNYWDAWGEVDRWLDLSVVSHDHLV
jgi:hypothetical protein